MIPSYHPFAAPAYPPRSLTDQDNPVNAPHFGTTESASQESLKVSHIFNQSPAKDVLLIHSIKEDNLTEDRYCIDPLFKRPGSCLTIYVPFNNSKSGEKRFFKNGKADQISTSFKTIYLVNFDVGAIRFTDSKGNPTKGRVIMDKTSKILDLDNTNAKIIQLRDKRPRKRESPANKF